MHVGASSNSLPSSKGTYIQKRLDQMLAERSYQVTSIPRLFWLCGEPVDDRSDVIEWGGSGEW